MTKLKAFLKERRHKYCKLMLTSSPYDVATLKTRIELIDEVLAQL